MSVIIARGDTSVLKFYLYDSANVAYHLTKEDKVYLGIMDFKQPFENALIKKVLTVDDMDESGEIAVRLDPKDTLDLYDGTYYCTVKLHRISKANNINEVITYIDRAKILINA